MEYKRFINNANPIVAQPLQINDLAGCFTVATSATLGHSYARAFRIKKIRMLAPVTTQGTSVTCQIIPFGIDTGNNSFSSVPEAFMDTSASIDVPAYVSLSPSIETPLGAWHYSTGVNQQLATITAPPGTTLDILFEYILFNSTPGISTYTRVLTGATIGQLSCGPLVNALFIVAGLVSS